MKNYYYFLGIEEQASEEDIKKAYRRLSLKYHPDKNNNDPFFVVRFRELQEAYEILSNSDKRKKYTEELLISKKAFKSSLPPYIKSFEASTTFLKKNDTITFKWITQNADIVKIFPFGLMPSYGEKSFKITEFKDGKFQVILHAQNSYTRQTVVKGITIYEGENMPQESNKEYNYYNNETEASESKDKVNIDNAGLMKLVILIIIMIIILLTTLLK